MTPPNRPLPQSQALEELEVAAKRLLVEQMRLRKWGYNELSAQLEAHGIFETPDRLNRKVNRQKFQASFLLACLVAMEVDVLDIGSVDISAQGRQRRLKAEQRARAAVAMRRRPPRSE